MAARTWEPRTELNARGCWRNHDRQAHPSTELTGQATSMKAIVQDHHGSAAVHNLRGVDMPAVRLDDVLVRSRFGENT